MKINKLVSDLSKSFLKIDEEITNNLGINLDNIFVRNLN